MDPRHWKRINIVQQIYSSLFDIPQANNKNTFLKNTNEILKNKEKLSNIIKKYAQKFPVENLAKVDLSILYLAIYELLFEKKTPPKVIINEAVQIAKELGGERSYAFVNGVLGKVYINEIEKKRKI
ncbi:MAG: transcription antitermination factor NusB [Microgenomates group bacterium]